MKTEMEKMRSGEPYVFTDSEMLASIHRANRMCLRLNALTMDDEAYRPTLELLVPAIAPSSSICPPFYCDHGSGIVVGEQTFINRGCSMLDEGFIRIGARCKVGPDCRFYTVNHPMDYREREGAEGASLADRSGRRRVDWRRCDGVPRREDWEPQRCCCRLGGV